MSQVLESAALSHREQWRRVIPDAPPIRHSTGVTIYLIIPATDLIVSGAAVKMGLAGRMSRLSF
jgi:hypothetical protein